MSLTYEPSSEPQAIDIGALQGWGEDDPSMQRAEAAPPVPARGGSARPGAHPLFLITYPDIAQCMGAWSAMGS